MISQINFRISKAANLSFFIYKIHFYGTNFLPATRRLGEFKILSKDSRKHLFSHNVGVLKKRQ
jgi:hypothetical protein